ncbi:MAG: pyridoxal phosphate-dependent aminotransferase [Nitrososphaeria archaeon]|nr:pyridoxal phosphate-dependent aminotransferase [Conexivisphaerales archaeon]
MKYTAPARLLELEESATLKASEKANEMIAKGINIYKLDVGEPDFSTPRKVIDSAYNAMLKGYTHYASSAGVLQLRQAIAEKYSVNPSNVIITPGSKQGIFYALYALLNPGDEVLLLNPAWSSYKQIVRLTGGVPVEVNTDEDFEPNLDIIMNKLNKKTRAIIINSPNNPTGAVYGDKIVKQVSQLAKENGLFVISDEIYDQLVYEGDYVSFRKYMGYEDGLILINGFSKAYAMTGWRLGYAIASPEIIKQMVKIQGHTATSPATFAQLAGITALKECEEDVKTMVKEFSERRKIIIEMLDKKGLKYVRPKGAFYFFIDLGKYIKGADPAEYLLEKARVSVTSGLGFGESYPTYIRISYATSRETIISGLNNIFSAIGI